MMRITTGIYKGRKLKGPSRIRPTQDKVRKALFDILGDISGLSFLELYAGSGAVGLEAASRGAGEVAMVEQDPECARSIRENVEQLKLKGAQLIQKEALSAIKAMHNAQKSFDIIFLDPPYSRGFSKKTLQTLGAYDILAPCGFTVVQHFKKDELPQQEGSLSLFKQSFYGDTALTFYRKVKAKNVPESHISG